MNNNEARNGRCEPKAHGVLRVILSAELEHGSFAPESVASEVWGLTRGEARQRADTYQRYHNEALPTEEKWKIPRRFNVKVGKFGLAKMIFKEFFQYFGHWETVFSRPCTYGVFSGPIGGFSPRPDLCVGCLRCEVQHPDFVTVTPNGELRALGDKYLTYRHIYTIDQEAKKGAVPVVTLDFIAHANVKEGYDLIELDGVPNLQFKNITGMDGDIGTVAILINSIRRVIESSPGFVTMQNINMPVPLAIT